MGKNYLEYIQEMSNALVLYWLKEKRHEQINIRLTDDAKYNCIFYQIGPYEVLHIEIETVLVIDSNSASEM